LVFCKALEYTKARSNLCYENLFTFLVYFSPSSFPIIVCIVQDIDSTFIYVSIWGLRGSEEVPPEGRGS